MNHLLNDLRVLLQQGFLLKRFLDFQSVLSRLRVFQNCGALGTMGSGLTKSDVDRVDHV